jgi:hypothetical protein
MDARKNYDRYSNAPILNERGRPIVALMVDRQPAVLRALAEHTTLTVYDLHAVVGGNLRSLRQTLAVLKAKPNELIRILPEQVRTRTLRQPIYYQLAPRGVEWLNANGSKALYPKRVYNIAHAGLVSHVMASIYAGVAQTANARFISWDDIQAHPKFPKNNGIAKDELRPDTHPFRIELLKDGIPTWRTLVIEADNGTETIKPSRPEKYTGNSIYAKFEAYLEFMRNEEFKKRYGLSNYFVLFVFTSRSRMDNAKALLTSMGGHRFILFQQAYQDPETPAGYIFTSVCERAGHAPIFLNQP